MHCNINQQLIAVYRGCESSAITMFILFVLLGALVASSSSSDITSLVFGNVLDGMPAAFGDFNSDELTDLFVLSKDGKTVQIMLASEEEPLLQPKKDLSCSFVHTVSSVVPGDFDGDVFMDILVTTVEAGGITNVYILWGGNDKLNCTDESDPFLKMMGQPLAMDYNHDWIIDLFGTNVNGSRTFWIFNSERTKPTAIPMVKPKSWKGMIWISTYYKSPLGCIIIYVFCLSRIFAHKAAPFKRFCRSEQRLLLGSGCNDWRVS